MREVVRMEEAKMIEELKKRGYRISKPKPKVEVEFKPFKAIEYGSFSGPREVTVIRETPKYVVVATQHGESQVRKGDIYEHDPEVIRIDEEADGKARELRDQGEKVEQDAGQKIRERLKPVYTKETERQGR